MMHYLFTNTPLAYFVASFWRDEAFSYLMARLPIHQLLWSTAQDANPPLYYILLKIWTGVFGSAEVALRSLSLIFFWATLYVAFLIMKEVFKLSQKKSLFYLILFLINPLLHYYAFEARMYSMMAFLATLLFYALMGKKYKLYAITALFALYTHYFLAVVIFFQVVFFLTTSYKNKKEYINFFPPLVKSVIWFFPWMILLAFAHPPIGSSFWVPFSTLKDIFTLPAVIFTGYEKDSWLVVSFLSLLSLFITGFVIYSSLHHVFRQKKLHFPLLLVWSFGIPFFIFVISFIKPIFVPRYFIFSAVGMLLLLIVCFESIKNKYIRGLLLSIIIFFSLSYSQIQILMRTKAPLKKTFFSIKSEMKSTDIVYVTHEYDFHPAEYYLPSKKVYIYKKTYEELPWFVGKVLIDKEAFKTTLPLYPVRAFILNNDGTYSIQSSL